MRRLPTAVLAALLAATSVAACGDDSSSSATSAGPGATVSTVQTSSASTAGSGPSSVASAVAEDQGKATGEPIRIAFVNSNQGAQSYPGFDNGSQAAAKYVNEKLNGVNGRPIELVPCGVDTTAEMNQKCGQTVANDDSIVGAMTGVVTNGGAFFSAVAAAGKYVYGGVASTPVEYSAPNTYYYLGGGAVSSRAIASLIKTKIPDVKTVSVMYVDNASGNGLLNILETELGAGIKTNRVGVPQEPGDLLAQATALTQGSPDAIALMLIPQVCGQLVLAFQTLPPNVPVFSNAQCFNPEVTSKGSVEGWFEATYNIPANVADGVDPGMDEFRKEYGNFSTASPTVNFTPEGWAGVLTMRQVLKAISGEITKATVGEALKTFTGPVVMGPEKVKCPGPAKFPSVCGATPPAYAFGFEWKDGGAHPAKGAEKVELSQG